MRAVIAVALALGPAVTACDHNRQSAQPGGVVSSHVRSGTQGHHTKGRPGLVADEHRILASFTLRSGRQGDLVLVTHGSSTCPWRPTSAADLGNGRIQVTVAENHNHSGVCTADDAPHVEQVPIPTGFSADRRPCSVDHAGRGQAGCARGGIAR
jgi:hypothetical protein